MAEQLAACARELFEGVPGSSEQRAANAWLMQFQVCDEAWQAALQLLEQPPRDAATGQPLAAPELVAMQILRLKTQQEWSRMTPQQKQIVRQSEVRFANGSVMHTEQQTIVCRGLSRVACSLAMNHAAALFSSQPLGIQAVGGQGATENQQQFALRFLEFLLVCSAHDDIDVVQPTLEIWFFFLEDHSSQNEISLQLLGAVGREHVVGVLSRLVNALIERCKFPQWFIESQQLSSDDPRIEAIATLRSLFAKWPGGPGKPRGDYVSCVKGMTQMLQDFSDVALIDALLYLLAYMVELFDVVSSDSESDDDQPPSQAPSGGVEVLMEVLNYSPQLPMHPLVVNGVASKYTDIEERTPLLQTLLSFCDSPPAGIAQESCGDLLEATFWISSGVSDAAGGQAMGDFLTQHHNAELLTAEIEQFMRLAREVLSSFPQTQEICDAACDFLLDAMRLQSAPILERIGSFATELVRIVVNFLGSKRLHYRVRNLWDFLFQCLHAPQISAQLRNGFQAAVSVVVLEQGALNSLLPAETCQQVATELASRHQRHRFRQYLSQLARFLEAGQP
ncbi:hypothetical protein BBJ28_00006747 [Nothophytophthora sp. Chile5]|nr:hypothetical protein BBJ28_00006747 [Nothophytophthora sp. Chile5]